MGFRYRLATADGEVFDEAEYAHQPGAGDVIRIRGQRQMRVTKYVTVERRGKFVGGTLYGVVEVERS